MTTVQIEPLYMGVDSESDFQLDFSFSLHIFERQVPSLSSVKRHFKRKTRKAWKTMQSTASKTKFDFINWV